ncbi:MAG: CpXC domain-containing protein [Nitrospira sp.]
MSRCEVQRVICPACGASRETKVFLSVNGARIKSAADRLIDGSWGLMCCLKCGADYHRPAPRLFTDIPGGLWIVRYDSTERTRYTLLEEEANRIFEREWLERTPAAIRGQALSAQRRVCFGSAQLREKLLLHRHAIDDRFMECVKLVMMREYVSDVFAFGPAEFYVHRIEPDRIGMAAVSIGETHAILDLTVEGSMLGEMVQDAERFHEVYPELFDKLYVNASRYVMESTAEGVSVSAR